MPDALIDQQHPSPAPLDMSPRAAALAVASVVKSRLSDGALLPLGSTLGFLDDLEGKGPGLYSISDAPFQKRLDAIAARRWGLRVAQSMWTGMLEVLKDLEAEQRDKVLLGAPRLIETLWGTTGLVVDTAVGTEFARAFRDDQARQVTARHKKAEQDGSAADVVGDLIKATEGWTGMTDRAILGADPDMPYKTHEAIVLHLKRFVYAALSDPQTPLFATVAAFLSNTLALNVEVHLDLEAALRALKPGASTTVEDNLVRLTKSRPASAAERTLLDLMTNNNVTSESKSVFPSRMDLPEHFWLPVISRATGVSAPDVDRFFSNAGYMLRLGVLPPLTGLSKKTSDDSRAASFFEKDEFQKICGARYSRVGEALVQPWSSDGAFYRRLTNAATVFLDTDDALAPEEFDHLGRDFGQLQAALTAPTPKRILIVGGSGHGKSALVRSALKAAQRTAITLPPGRRSSDAVIEDVYLLRHAAKLFNGSVTVWDGAARQVLSDKDILPAFDRIDPAQAGSSVDFDGDSGLLSAPEIWVVDDVKRIPAAGLAFFDLVVSVTPMPLAKRQSVAKRLFENHPETAEAAAKSCAAIGDIVKLANWSKETGQTSWADLAPLALAQQRAALAVQDHEKTLPLTLVQPGQNHHGFDQVVGAPHAVAQARRLVAALRDPQRFAAFGANVQPPKGVLLTGGPGLGKTYLAGAMAHEAGVPLLVADSAAMAAEPDTIARVFAEARRQAPCVLFLDEVDAVGASAKRQDGGSADPQRQAILNRLLTELSGLEDLTGVLVVGATHRSEVLDEALTRSGRLKWNIALEHPDRAQRTELWRFYTNGTPGAEDLDLTRLARASTGLSPADIAEAKNNAVLCAAMDGADRLTTAHALEAIDRVGLGLSVDTPLPQNDTERRQVAVHEGGHALLAWGFGKDIERVSVRPTAGALGFVRSLRPEDRNGRERGTLDEDIIVSYGGLVAEETVLGLRREGAGSDLHAIRTNVQHMVRGEGMSDELPMGVGNFAGANTIRTAETVENRLAASLKRRAAKALDAFAPAVEALAAHLMDQRELSGVELDTWLRARGITPDQVRAATLSAHVGPASIVRRPGAAESPVQPGTPVRDSDTWTMSVPTTRSEHGSAPDSSGSGSEGAVAPARPRGC